MMMVLEERRERSEVKREVSVDSWKGREFRKAPREGYA